MKIQEKTDQSTKNYEEVSKRITSKMLWMKKKKTASSHGAATQNMLTNIQDRTFFLQEGLSAFGNPYRGQKQN